MIRAAIISAIPIFTFVFGICIGWVARSLRRDSAATSVLASWSTLAVEHAQMIEALRERGVELPPAVFARIPRQRRAEEHHVDEEL